MNVLCIFGLVLGKTQEEGLRRVEELKTELNLLKEEKRDEKKRQTQLQQAHDTLTDELTKEKVTQTFFVSHGPHSFYVYIQCSDGRLTCSLFLHFYRHL